MTYVLDICYTFLGICSWYTIRTWNASWYLFPIWGLDICSWYMFLIYILDIHSWYEFLIWAGMLYYYALYVCSWYMILIWVLDICFSIHILDMWVWYMLYGDLDICSWYVISTDMESWYLFLIGVRDICSRYIFLISRDSSWYIGRTNLISSIKEGGESLFDILRKKGDVERRSGDGESYPVGWKYMLYAGRGTQGSYSRCRYIVLDIVLDICYNYWYIFLIYVLDMFLAGICSWYMGWIYVLDIRYKWTYVLDSICSGYMFLLHVSDTCFLYMNALDIYCWYIYVRERQVEHGMPFRRC